MPNSSSFSGAELISRIERAVTGLRAIKLPQWIKPLAWLAAMGLFAGGLILAALKLDLQLSELTLWPMGILVALAIPTTLLLNTVETDYAARLFGRSFGFARAFRLTLFASAANMLPLPGAAVVRVASLSSLDVPMKAGGATTLAMALNWLGVSAAVSGLFLLGIAPVIAIPALVGAGILILLSIAWLYQVASVPRTIAGIVLVKTVMTVLAVLRLMLCFEALGAPMPFALVSVFAVSRVLGSAASIFPAGLGIRELVSAALAPLVGISAPLAFLATALDRLVAMAVLLTLSALLGATSLNSAKTGTLNG
ncbi:MAG: lysylphosphatidylglycerol synthase domain-containing protein [Hyphomonadaceae bacterium]|nr:lysylphosphatidylglycerol synthase domain-containing protein [Hyphomonadaceae bacterium]